MKLRTWADSCIRRNVGDRYLLSWDNSQNTEKACPRGTLKALDKRGNWILIRIGISLVNKRSCLDLYPNLSIPQSDICMYV